jgi:hypothetical protein
VPGGQCHRQTIQFVNFQATLNCGNGTTQNCTAPCTGLATLTACVIADPTELPVSLTLTNNAGLPTQTATITSVDANFSGCTTFNATLTQTTTFTLSASDAQGCTRSGISKTVTVVPLTAPSLTITTPTCAGGSTVLSASPSGLTDYTFQVDGTNYDNGTNPTLTLPFASLGSGSHSAKVTVANTAACTAASPSSAFTLPTAVTTSLDLGSNTSCNGSVTFTATGSGGSGSYTFAWTVDGSAVANNNTNHLTYSPSSTSDLGLTHTITATATDSLGCTSTNTATNTESECVAFTIQNVS